LKNKLIKNSKRIFLIIVNSIKQTMGQFISLLLSFFVIHYYSKDLWGNFSSYFIYINICLLIASWGNKDFLIREFSKTPNKIAHLLYLLFNTRLILVLLLIVTTLTIYPLNESLFLIIWLLSCYISQSLEVFWIYKRDYFQSISIEFISFLGFMVLLYTKNDLNIFALIKFYSYYQITRTILYIIFYFKELKKIHFKINKTYLITAFPFFLLSFVGFLQSRTDFLMIIFFEKNENIAIYQVINTYFILIHALGTFMIFPFMKNLYRLNKKSMYSAQKLITTFAPYIVITCLIFLYLLIHFFYNFNLDFYYYIIGFFITLPPYFYAVKIIQLFKENKQKIVLKIGIKAILINSILTFILLFLNFGLKGALIGSAIAQIYTATQYLKLVNLE